MIAHDQRELQQVGALALFAAGEPVQQGIDRQQLRHGGGRRGEHAANGCETDHFPNPFALAHHRPQGRQADDFLGFIDHLGGHRFKGVAGLKRHQAHQMVLH